MPDMEKVELGIKACWSEYFSHKCFDCPYVLDRNDRKCVERLGTDTLALLKEQEQTIETLKEKLRLLEYGNHDCAQDVLMPAT